MQEALRKFFNFEEYETNFKKKIIPEAALTANEESLAGLQELLTAGEISKIGGIGHFLPSPVRQTAQIKHWNDFWERHRDSVRTYLAEEGEKLGFRADAFHLFEEIIGRTWEKTALLHFNPIKKTLAQNYVLENDGTTDRKSVV